jgi:hypothetical protein
MRLLYEEVAVRLVEVEGRMLVLVLYLAVRLVEVDLRMMEDEIRLGGVEVESELDDCAELAVR